MCSQCSLSNTAVTLCLCPPLDETGFDPYQRKEISLFSETPGLALGHTQSPIQMATGCSFAVGLRGQGVRLAAQIHLVTSLRMSGALCFCSPCMYLLNPWSRVLLEKLTGLQVVKKFPAFYGTRRFITECTSGTVVKVLCYKTEGRWFDPN